MKNNYAYLFIKYYGQYKYPTWKQKLFWFIFRPWNYSQKYDKIELKKCQRRVNKLIDEECRQVAVLANLVNREE